MTSEDKFVQRVLNSLPLMCCLASSFVAMIMQVAKQIGMQADTIKNQGLHLPLII